MSTHHMVGLAKWLEVLGLAQPPVDLGQSFFFFGLNVLICKMGGVDWLWGKQNLRGRSLSSGS